MFTPESLRTIAQRASLQLLALPAAHEQIFELNRQVEFSNYCADWMEHHGLNELRWVGPFGPAIPVSRGDVLVLRAGVTYKTTAPEGVRTSKRRQKITVHRCQPGHIRTDLPRPSSVVNPEIRWAGAQGYWCWAPIECFELPPGGSEAA